MKMVVLTKMQENKLGSLEETDVQVVGVSANSKGDLLPVVRVDDEEFALDRRGILKEIVGVLSDV